LCPLRRFRRGRRTSGRVFVEGLAACLDRAEASARGDTLGALLDIAVWERTSGGYGVGLTDATEDGGLFGLRFE